MKRTIGIIALAALSAVASASSQVDELFDQCQKVMQDGTCTVALDRASYSPGGRTLVSGMGRIKNESYLKFRNVRWGMEPDGVTYSMCAPIKVVCNPDLTEVDPTTDDCKAARGFKRQTPARQASGWERVYAWVTGVNDSRE